jgi:Spy/CpxP family protein refolding chaperone
MVKKILTVLVLAAFSLSCFTGVLYAGGKSGKNYGLEGKFYRQAHKILEHNKELGLTAEQVKKIKALKAQVRKDMIQQDADIQTLKVEINTMMWEAPMDLDETNGLVEQKYELKKKKAKYMVSAYDKLNKILTKEQLKELSTTF